MLNVHTGSVTIPDAGLGNSTFNTDYNLIAVGEPVQIVIPDGIIWGDVTLEFRLPGHTGSHEIDSNLQGSGAILWGLIHSDASLYPSRNDEMIVVGDI